MVFSYVRVIPEASPGPLVTFASKSRTVCINTTISSGMCPFVTQDFEIYPGKKKVLALKI
jgi:hypothetical protein